MSAQNFPGGKGKLINYFKQIFEENSLKGGVYVEPYVGGASVALSHVDFRADRADEAVDYEDNH